MDLTDRALVDALVRQYNFERYSADIYLSLGAQLDILNLTGFAHWMYAQAGEERSHADKFKEYLIERNVMPVVAAVPAPNHVVTNALMDAPRSAFEMALAHEKLVTERINDLYGLARETEDYPTEQFLHWFVKEQVEEEHSLEEILTKFAYAAGNGAAILMLNEELGER
jgi:ferritin